MTDLVIAHCATAQPMGAHVYQDQVLRRAPEVMRAQGWDTTTLTARSLRSPLPGSHRVPLGRLHRASGWTRRVYGRALYRGADLVHRMDLALPPARHEVVTLHDVIAWRFPDETAPIGAAAEELRRAQAVVCVSQFSAQEATDLLGLRHVHVVPNGVDSAFLDARPASAQALGVHGIRTPFVMVGAGSTERKNLRALAAAWAVVHRRRPEVQLVLTGPTHPRRDALFTGLPQVVRTGWLPTDRIPPLMAAAEAVVLPSTYEGFGLPALEAMAVGTALVATDIPAVREVVGDPCLLVPPDVDGLVDGLDLALGRGRVVADAIERGRLRARELSWDATVAGHVRVWQSVVEGTAC